MKNILITGVSGFIGRGLARHFVRSGYQVYGVDRVPHENAPTADLGGYLRLNLPSPRLRDILKQWSVDCVLHCAGRSSVPAAMQEPRSDFANGPMLTFSLLASLREFRPEAIFVHLSSAAVYGNPAALPVKEQAPIKPISAYGFHKWQGEIACHEFAKLWGIKTVSVRIFSAYGPGLRRQVIWDIVHKALNGRTEIILQGTGRESRDFVHVNDIARGMHAIIDHAPMTGEVYNLAGGTEIFIDDLAGMILKTLKSKSSLKFSGELPPGTPRNWQADISAISRLGFQPQVDFAEGVSSSVGWATREIMGV